MLTIRCCGGAIPEVELAGNPAEFDALASLIATLDESKAGAFSVSVASCDPAPYERCLSTLRVVKDNGPLSVVPTADSLTIAGGPTTLRLLARSLPVEPGLRDGYHIHIEHPGREETVARDSVPLILLVEGIRDAWS